MILVTSNENKWREACRILGREIERASLDLPEIQAATTSEVALTKARAAAGMLDAPAIVEDTGVELVALGGFPGPFIKFWETLGGLESICRALDGLGDRSAVAVCALGVCSSGVAYVVEGRLRGTIADAPRGTGGFGWDAIFIPEGESRTLGEMSAEEKDAISHRRLAWQELTARLEG